MQTTFQEQIQAIQKTRTIIQENKESLFLAGHDVSLIDKGLNDAGSTIAAINFEQHKFPKLIAVEQFIGWSIMTDDEKAEVIIEGINYGQDMGESFTKKIVEVINKLSGH